LTPQLLETQPPTSDAVTRSKVAPPSRLVNREAPISSTLVEGRCILHRLPPNRVLGDVVSGVMADDSEFTSFLTSEELRA
jgi:hypothetical protein